MLGLRSIFVLLLLGLAPLAGASTADEPAVAPTAQSSAQPSARDADARLARWKSMDPARRAELTRRFKEIERLSPEARQRLGRRAEKLAQEMERALEALPAERRAWVESLPAQERTRVLRGLVAERARSSAARIRERLTPDERQRLEGATAEERAAILRGVRKREYGRLPEALGRLGRELGVGPRALSEALDKDPEQARQLLIDYVRRRAQRRAERHGPPTGYGADEWARTLELPDAAFVRAYARARFADVGRSPGKNRMAGLARELEVLTRPTLEMRASSKRQREGELRRAALLERRGEVEALLARRLQLRPETVQRIAALDAERFTRAVLRVRRALKRGEDPVRVIAQGARRDRGSRR